MRRPRRDSLLHPPRARWALILSRWAELWDSDGRQAARHSIRVNDQYRLTFRWENGHAFEVCVEDDH